MNVRTLEVNVNNLVRGQRYIVTRRKFDGAEETFNGTFSSAVPNANIVFNGVRGRGTVSFPMAWLISVNVAVSDLPSELNQHVNRFIGGKSKRKRKSNRHSLSGSRTRVSRVKGEHHNR